MCRNCNSCGTSLLTCERGIKCCPDCHHPEITPEYGYYWARVKLTRGKDSQMIVKWVSSHAVRVFGIIDYMDPQEFEFLERVGDLT